MHSETERRFYTREGQKCWEKYAFLVIERIYHYEMESDMPVRIERRAWLVSAPNDVKEFKNKKELDGWMKSQVGQAET
jgi:hypothetical protein